MELQVLQILKNYNKQRNEISSFRFYQRDQVQAMPFRAKTIVDQTKKNIDSFRFNILLTSNAAAAARVGGGRARQTTPIQVLAC